MKKILLAASVLVSLSASADYSRRIEVYKVVGVKAVARAEEWATLKTASGLDVFVRCSDASFDDPTHDRVGGFKTSRECSEFLTDLTKSASPAKPVSIQIGPDFLILIEKEMLP